MSGKLNPVAGLRDDFEHSVHDAANGCYENAVRDFAPIPLAVGAAYDGRIPEGAMDGVTNALSRLKARLPSGDRGALSPPFKTPWGWSGSASYRDVVKAIDQAGTHEEVGGITPTQAQAIQLIEDAGGIVQRIEGPHEPPNPHSYPLINYTTSSGLKGTIRIEGLDP